MRERRKIKLLRLAANEVNLVVSKDGQVLLEVDDTFLFPSLPTAFPFDWAEVSLNQVNQIHAETQCGQLLSELTDVV